jgi:hypothetical protein
MRWPGIEPGSTAWKAAMLTIIPPSLFALGLGINKRNTIILLLVPLISVLNLGIVAIFEFSIITLLPNL